MTADQKFDKLHSEYERLVLAVVSRVLPNRSDVQEVVQDTWIAVYHALQSRQKVRNVRLWIEAITRNAALNRRREIAAAKTESLDVLARRADDGEEMEIDIPQDEPVDISAPLKELIRAAVDQLSPALRETIDDHYYRGLSIEQIAIERGIPSGSIKRRLHDARVALAEILVPIEEVA